MSSNITFELLGQLAPPPSLVINVPLNNATPGRTVTPKFRSTRRHSLASLAHLVVLIAALAFGGIPAQAQQGPIQATVLEGVELPGLPPGPQTLRMSMLEMQPGAKVPPHTHAGPGIR